MRISHLLNSTCLALMGAAAVGASASAQQTDGAIPTVVIDTGGAPSSAYSFGDPIDSGATTISREAVEARAPGSGDVNEVLKALPTVQFTSTQGQADRASLQDLRPENISISGGSVYENLFIVDGVGSNSRLDVEGSSPGDYNEVAAGSAQTLWVDSSLVGSLTLRDSNVSAEFGQFTGGVVQIETRSPNRVFGGQVYYGKTSDNMAEYKLSDVARDSFSGALPEAPTYDKERYGVSLDLPVNDRFRLLAGYNRSSTEATYFPHANYAQYGVKNLSSLSENYLLKGEYDAAADLKLSGQVTWSPYESEFSTANTLDNLIVSHGGGLNARLGLEGRRGAADWSLQLTHAYSDNDREAPGTIYTLSTSIPAYANCSLGSSCVFGSVGPLKQQQHETGLKGTWSQPLGGGLLRAGFDYSHIEAKKIRETDAFAYTGIGSTNLYQGANVVCAVDEGRSCVTGAYAITRKVQYGAFDARVNLDAYSLWGEYDVTFSGFQFRAGLRYDYESFLENHNFAPRLSVSRDLPWWGVNVTAGVNRYYGRSFLGYALREGQGQTRNYTRTPTVANGVRTYSDNWVLASHTNTTRWSDQGLDTPYSDELTLALRGPIAWIGGEYRIKGVLRDNKDQFSSSLRESGTYVTDAGTTATSYTYKITNDGERSYEGLSLEYVRPIGRDHTVSLSTNFSHTDATNISYFDIADEVDLEGERVYYKGEVVTKLRALADNQLEDYAAPLIINADWSANWFDGRLKTNVNSRYRSSFERVGDTFVNITVDGSSYDVYAKQKYGNSVDVNLSATLSLLNTRAGETLLDVRVNNLFNTVLNEEYTDSSEPYQLGRNVWLSVKHRF